MSDSVRPYPWDSPGKNTGVGCHFFLQCIKVKSESEVTQSCLTLRYPMDCSLPGSSAHGIFQARALEWGAIAFSERIHLQCRKPDFNPWSGRSPGRGHGNPLQYSCLKNPHGQRRMVGYGSWSCKESEMTEQLTHMALCKC